MLHPGHFSVTGGYESEEARTPEGAEEQVGRSQPSLVEVGLLSLAGGQDCS